MSVAPGGGIQPCAAHRTIDAAAAASINSSPAPARDQLGQPELGCPAPDLIQRTAILSTALPPLAASDEGNEEFDARLCERHPAA
jgi:hypothetical protein